MALYRSPESFFPQLNSTYLFLWLQLVTLMVGPVLTPKESYEEVDKGQHRDAKYKISKL